MPTYEYKCGQCGTFEHWQNIKDDPLAACPTCGSPVKRLISRNVNIIFKGPGFYVTDNRSQKGGSGSGDGGGESGGTSSNGSASTTEKSASASSD